MNRVYRLAGLARHAAKAVNKKRSALIVSDCNLLPCQVQHITAASLPSSHSKISRSFSSGVVTTEDIEHTTGLPALNRLRLADRWPTVAFVVQSYGLVAPPTQKGFQKIIQLPAKQRGCHIITRNLLQELPELREYEVGMVNLFVMHNSASLTINESVSPDAPQGLNDSLDRIAPEGLHSHHADEGSDDMPAHVKSSLMGASLNIPVRQGDFAMGPWQGLYLNEHRNHGGSLKVCVTIQGQKHSAGRKYPASLDVYRP